MHINPTNAADRPSSQTHSTHEAMDTAQRTTIGRALAACEPDAQVRCGDHLAKHFVQPSYRIFCLFPRLSKWFAEKDNPGAYYYMIARTNHIDTTLKHVLQDGIDQLVMLGAGYDSRPCRFAEELRGTRVFEVDFPGTQAKKLKQLTRVLGRIPEEVTFVPIDFNAQSLEEVLLKSGFQPSKRTFYIWEGVCFYLTPDAVDAVLGFVRNHSATGSSIIFDYVNESFVRGEYRNERERKAAKAHARIGESYIFGIKEGGIESFLADRGFMVLSDLGPQELDHTYLTRSDGTLHGHVFDFIRIVHAMVK